MPMMRKFRAEQELQWMFCVWILLPFWTKLAKCSHVFSCPTSRKLPLTSQEVFVWCCDHTCPELQLQFHVSSPVILCVPVEMWNPSYIFRDKRPLSAWNTANLDIWGSLVVVRLVWVCVCVPFLFTHMQKTWRGSLFLLFLNFNCF